MSIALGASTLLAALTVLMGAPVGRLELRISPREAGAMLVLDTITVTGGEESSAVRLVVPARAGY